MPIELPLHNGEATLPECRRAARRIVNAFRRHSNIAFENLERALTFGLFEAGVTAQHVECFEEATVRKLDAILNGND